MKILRVLLAAALFAGAAAGSTPVDASPKTVVVVIHHSRFSPDQMKFHKGDEVRFLIRNADPIDHEFILGDDAVQELHEKGTEPRHGDVPGEVSIAAGEMGKTNYVFQESGRLTFACHFPGHFAYGMKGTVRVG